MIMKIPIIILLNCIGDLCTKSDCFVILINIIFFIEFLDKQYFLYTYHSLLLQIFSFFSIASVLAV